MKLKINRFKELVDKTISLPQAIVSGANGAGKTSILEAFYFVIDGKKSDGMNVGGEIYPQYAKTKSELIVEVELEISDTTKFCRRCEGSEKREKGSVISELVRNINTTLIIEKDGKRDVVTQKDWNEQISAYFPENWRYLTNPNFLQAQKQSDVKDFVFDLLKLSEFDTKNKDIAKSKVAEKNTEIAKLDILIQEYEKAAQEPTKVEDLTENFNTQISELRAKINVPTLSEKDVLHNSKINKQIAEIQAQEPKLQDFENEVEIPVLVGKSFLPLNDVSELEKEIEELKNKEFDNAAILTTLEVAEKRNAKKAKIQEKIKNYANIAAGLKCGICPICSDLFCESRKIDIESLKELELMNSELNYVSIEDLKLKFDLTKAEFETEKSNKIAELESELKKLQADNEKIKNQNAEIKAENTKAIELHNAQVAEINAKNEEIRANNEKIRTENAKLKATFEAEKSAKLAELRALIKYPAKVDNSEIEAEIVKLEAQKEDNRQLFLNYTKLLAVYSNAKKEIVRLQEEKTALLTTLVDFEQNYIIEKQKEFQYYQVIENQINSELAQFGVKFKLYRKLISTDDFKADFSIILNDRDFNSNGEAFIQKIALCEFFQKTNGVILPIFCDETAILDEYNLNKLIEIFEVQKNIVLLEKTSEELTIINF
jgi:DNA repair exonuclease SbcCD ATPase subunit